MIVSKKAILITLGLFYLGGVVTSVHAQILQPLGPIDFTNDTQLFAPVELDFGNEPTGRTDGYFFIYDKTYGAIGGERTVVGDPNITRETNPVWYDRLSNVSPNPGSPFPVPDLNQLPLDPLTGKPLNPDSGPPGARNVINRPLRSSGLRSAPPDSVFAWGDRYEFGYRVDHRGWQFSVLDGPDQNHAEIYGTTASLNHPLGEVYIAFDYEPGLMHGFLDLRVSGVVDIILPADTDGDGVLDGDGIIDDIDGDGQHGPIWFDIDDPARIPDTDLKQPPDYDDLVELPTAFNQVNVRNSSKTHGIELMQFHEFSGRHMMKKHQNNHVEMSYGVRYFRFQDEFAVTGFGGTLGNSFWDMELRNHLIGPQVGLRWYNQRGRWTTEVNSRFMFGYNVTNSELDGVIGNGLRPGSFNNPLYLSTTTFNYGRQDHEFSPLVELRLETKYRISKSLAFKLGYTGMFVDNIRRAAGQVVYRLPDMGIRNNGTENFMVNNVTFGFELNY